MNSMYAAAVMAEAGLGTSRKPYMAQAMYRRAAQSGFVPAMLKVSEHDALRGRSDRDSVEAGAWLLLAMQSGVRDDLLIPVLSNIERIGARLPPGRRDRPGCAPSSWLRWSRPARTCRTTTMRARVARLAHRGSDAAEYTSKRV